MAFDTAAVAAEFSKITARHLRRAEETCRRRLAKELEGYKGNPPGAARFGVANRLTADVRLAHTELGPPDRRAFVVPSELLPEQQRVYQAGVAGYLALFGDAPGRSVDVGFDTALADLEVRLVGDVGVALDTDAGAELRVLRLGERGFNQPLFDDVDRWFALVRSEAWLAGAATLRIVVADVLNVQRAEFTADVATELPPARAWLETRIDVIRGLAADPVARAGQDCLGCRFVNGCGAHRF
jgi:hypothetical protein